MAGNKNEQETKAIEAGTDAALVRYDDADSRLSLAEVISALALPDEDFNPAEWSASITGGADYYWPAGKDQKIRGVILGYDRRLTRLVIQGRAQEAGFFTIQLLAPCEGIDANGEVQLLEPGKLISVLERHMLRGLQKDIGKEILLICDGEGQTRGGQKLWRYRSWVKKEVPGLPGGPREVQTIETTGQASS